MTIVIALVFAAGCGRGDFAEGERADGLAGESDTDEDVGESDSPGSPPTWHQDIAPIVHRSCVVCHHADGPGGFALEDHEQAAPLSDLMAESISDGSMPPFGAASDSTCVPPFGWLHDPSLSDDEIVLMKLWEENGAPEGDPDSAAPLPERPNLELEGADKVLEFLDPGPPEAASAQRCWKLDPGNDTDRWVTAIQFTHPDAATIHSVQIQIVDASELSEGDDTVGFDCGIVDGSEFESNPGPPEAPHNITTWVPGALPWTPPEGTGSRVEPGQNFLVKLRYLDAWATSSDLQDLHLDIRWTEEEPTLSSMTAFYGVFGNIQIGLQEDKNDIPGQPEFRIPAGATGHVETFEATFPDWFPVLRVWGIGGSMGPLGVEMEVQVVHAPPRACEQTAQCLLHIGSYDPRWPMIYEYDYAGEELVEIRGGDTLTVRCTYDNSLDNPHLVDFLEEAGLDELQDVTLIGDVLREHCFANFAIAQDGPMPEPGDQ